MRKKGEVAFLHCARDLGCRDTGSERREVPVQECEQKAACLRDDDVALVVSLPQQRDDVTEDVVFVFDLSADAVAHGRGR